MSTTTWDVGPASDGLLRQIEHLRGQVRSLQHELSALERRDAGSRRHLQGLEEELRLAARLQRDFLPKRLPQLGRVHFHTLFRPAGYVSGDLYDVMRLDEHHIGFFLADAVGHGMPAALLTMFIKRALVTKEITGGSYRLLPPTEAMARLNQALIEQQLSEATFATAIYGLIDTRTLRVSFARGGHPEPILLPVNGAARQIGADGCLLGIFPDETFTGGTVHLHSGDRLFIYSDGIDAAFSNTAGNGSCPEQLLNRRSLDTAQLLAEFSKQLDHPSPNARPQDDATMIVLEVGQ